MGPVVTPENKKRIEGYIQLAADEGSELVIDGRGRNLQGYEEGFFLWPSLIDHATQTMKSYQDEIFGPVLQIVRAQTFEEALSYPSLHHQGNAVTVFTRNGDWAQRFVAQVAVGMVGVNFPCQRRSATTAMAAGRTQLSATSINMARTASASSRAPRT